MAVEGVTSDARQRLKADADRLRAIGLSALIDYYAATDDAARQTADATLRQAFDEAMKAERQQDELEELQAEHVAKSSDIERWLRTL